MRSFLLSFSGKYQAILIIGMTICSAFITAAICGHFFDVRQLTANTDLIACVYQVMGTVYAILLTFTLWGVWQSFTEAGASVQNEAYALLDLIHIIDTSTTWKKDNALREAAINYATLVVKQEWPLLKNFTKHIINLREHNRSSSLEIAQAIQKIIPNNERDNILFSQALRLLERWFDARRTRILVAQGNSAKALWPLLFTGALVLFAFNGLFVAQTIGIWITLLFGISLVIGVTFYLIFSLDCPFDGWLSIDSEPFEFIINILKQTPNK